MSTTQGEKPESSSMEDKSVGQLAYEAYSAARRGGKSLVSGQAIPEWGRLPDEIQAAWMAAGKSVSMQPAIEDGPVTDEWLFDVGFRRDRYDMLRRGYVFTESSPKLIGRFYYGEFDKSFLLGDLGRKQIIALVSALFDDNCN